MNAGTVLIAEDEPSLRGLIRRVLEGAGYQVLEARNGVEALHRCGSERVDVVITDVCMPHLDGVSLVHKLSQEAAPRFIVMSARRLERRLPAGVIFLRKPFTRDELLDYVRMLTFCETSRVPSGV